MEKNIEKLLREAARLESEGWPFAAMLIRAGVENKTPASAVGRVVTILEKAKRFSQARRLQEIVAK